MKTFTAHVHKEGRFQATAFRIHVPAMDISWHDMLALTGALVVVSATAGFWVWVAGIESLSNIVAAGTWGMALVFFGLAVNSRVPVAVLQALTGVALIVLAGMQSTVSPDYAVGSGVLTAVWAGIAACRALR
jgi:hypothetical protein